MNVLFMLLDDLGWQDIGCAGSAFYETPTLDAMRNDGMFFTNAYATCPVCSPSRASVLTGMYPARLGLTDWLDFGSYHPCKGALVDAPYIKHIPDGIVTLPESLRRNGWQTWHVGKWHLGEKPYYPDRAGFEKNIGGCSWGHPHKGYFCPYGIETLPDGAFGEHLTDRLTDEAIGLINSRYARVPFFLNMCYYDVHTPIEGKTEDIAYFEAKARRMGLNSIDPMREGELFPIENKRHLRVTRRILQSDPVYAAMILNLDRNIARLLDALKSQGIYDDTLIIFTSDNGGLATAEGSPTCNAPASEGKGWMYEGGVRVPFIAVNKPRISARSICETPVTGVDFYPTIMNLAGLNMPDQPCDGVDITPLLIGKNIDDRPIFWHYPHYGNQGGTPGSSVRLGDYKLIEFFEDMRSELYDLQSDVGEHDDLTKIQPDVTEKLRAMLHAWQNDVGAVKPRGKNLDFGNILPK